MAVFHDVAIAGAVDADVAIAAEPHLEISGDDNLVPLVTTEVASGRLQIDTRKHVRPSLPLVAHIAAPQVSRIEISGSSHVVLHGLQADRLAIDVSGSGTFRGDGAVHQLAIEITGSGDLALDQLAAERASVKVLGSGNVSIAVSQALEVHITGSGTVTYQGNPSELKQDVTGSGHLVKR
ncbi:MAG TPA: head GIN domain-containing protein [Kofleriaceae bacterium]|nr:head GIN domain-containing protein [Kofleriaceae bacterium]